MGRYEDAFRRSLDDPAGFWADAATAIDWYTKPERILDDSNPPFYRWYPGGMLNTCHNAVDRHVDNGHGDQPALIYDSPVTGTKSALTFTELRDETARFAGALAALGITKGDRVVIYMPMIPEAVIAMLACARLGAVHSVVFGGFAAHELAVRIDDAKPRLIVSASCGIEVARVVQYKPILDAAVDAAAHKPEHTIIVQRPQAAASMRETDLDWHGLMGAAPAPAPCVPVDATDPLYILYTSGTTGKPKGVVRDNGGHAVALTWSMRNIYDTHQGEVFWAASDIGWVVGHSYIVYAPLLAGCTTILYEGQPPGGGRVRGVRRQRRDQGRGPARPGGAQGGGHRATGATGGGTGPDDPDEHRPYRHARQARHRAGPPEDPFGEDPAEDHARPRERQGRTGPVHHR